MRTIERNYVKKPHTARFLMTFHSAAYGLPSDIEETKVEDTDLLDLVEDKDVVDLRTPGQTSFMDDLISRLTKLDPATGEAARDYTQRVTEKGGWTTGRTGNASAWIDRMIQKERELKAAAPAPTAQPTGEVEIPANYYGIHADGEVKCYQVDYGKDGTKWEGFLFLSRVSSDDRFPVKNPGEKARILAAIREDVEAAQILAGLTMRRCRRCGRGLSDTKNPYFDVALGPDCGAM